MTKSQKIAWILFYILIFSFLLFNSFSYLDHDLGWHLRVGEQIAQEKSVPNFEYYDYTLEGKTWVDHEWLLNLTSFEIYENFGYIALTIAFALLVIAVFIIQAVFIKKYTKKNIDFFVMFFQLLGLIGMSPHLGVRMQEIALFNILLLLIIIFYYNQNKKIQTLFWLLPLFIFWANTHASFLIGLFIFAFWIFVKILENILVKFKFFDLINFEYKINKKEIITSIGFFFLVASSTLLNPYGLKLYTFLGEYTNTFYMKLIAEWLPIYYYPIHYKQLFYSAIITSILIVLVYSSYKFVKNQGQKKNISMHKIDLWHFLLTVLFLILAFKSKRHFPLLFLVSLPLMVNFISTEFKLSKNILSLNKKNYIIASYLVMVVLVTTSSFFIRANYTNDPFQNKKYCQRMPCEAINFLKNNEEYKNLKIFNNYGWGGYMIWVWPEKKLFIDGRLPQYKYNKHALLQEYYDFFDEETLENKLDRYNIKLVFLKINQPIKLNWIDKYVMGLDEEKINDQKNNLKEYLQKNLSWDMIYEDKITQIYFKK